MLGMVTKLARGFKTGGVEDQLDARREGTVGSDADIEVGIHSALIFVAAAGRLKTGQYLRPHAADPGLARNAERPEVGDIGDARRPNRRGSCFSFRQLHQ